MFPCKRVLRAAIRTFAIRLGAGLCDLKLTFVLAFLSLMACAQTTNTAGGGPSAAGHDEGGAPFGVWFRSCEKSHRVFIQGSECEFFVGRSG